MSTLETLAGFISSALRRLVYFAGDADATGARLAQLIGSLGWTLPGAPPPSLQSLSQPVAKLMQDLWALDDATARRDEGSASDLVVDSALLLVAEDVNNLSEAVKHFAVAMPAEFAADYLATTQIAQDLGPRLLDTLLIDAMSRNSPIAAALLQSLGVIEVKRMPEATAIYQPAFNKKQIHWSRLGTLISDPAKALLDAFNWGNGDLLFSPITYAIQSFSHAMGSPAQVDFPSDALASVFNKMGGQSSYRSDRLITIPVLALDAGNLTIGLTRLPTSSSHPEGLAGLAVTFAATLAQTSPVPLGRRVSLSLDSPVNLASGIAVGLRPQANPTAYFDIEGSGSILGVGRHSIRINYDREFDEEDLRVLSFAGGSTLDIRSAYVGAGVENYAGDVDALLEVGLKQCTLNIGADANDGFVSAILPSNGVTGKFDLDLAWSKKLGVRIGGSGSLSVKLPVHFQLGPVAIESLKVTVQADNDGVEADLGMVALFSAGPVTLRVEEVGVTVTCSFIPGNLGPVDCSLGPRPPSGVGVSIDAGVVHGSGFLDFDSVAGRYEGALALDVEGIAVSAIGVLDTKPPGGGYSFAGIISATFEPLQLGLGFTLNGVGGMLALNRRADEDALKNALKGPGVDDIFFPTDPVAQAGRIVTDLAQYFPPANGRHVFGPAARIGWGTPQIVSADVALVVEVPAPIKVLLLGNVHAGLPTLSSPIIDLHVDVLGIFDFAKKRLEIDARLRNSKVLDFTIEGGVGLLVEWGDQPNFVLSVGGFNPRFVPPPNFLVPPRVRIPIGFDDDPRLDVTGYLAVTPNTAQIGARVDLYASAGLGLSIDGDLAFDALFEFNPFSFTVDIAADVSLKRNGSELAGVHLHGTLSGPSPWHVSGNACLSCWFFDLCVPFDATFGGSTGDITPSLDPGPALALAIADPANWKGPRPPAAFQSVTLSPAVDGTKLIDPLAQPLLKQTVVPFNRKITKYLGATPIGGTVRYDVTQVTLGGITEDTTDVTDWFSPGAIEQLTDDERLSRGAYEKMTAGFSLDSDMTSVGHSVTKSLGYDTIVVRNRWDEEVNLVTASFVPTQIQQFAAIALGSAANATRLTTGAAKYAPPLGTSPKVALVDEGFVVASTVDLAQQTGITATPIARGAAYGAMADYLASHPSAAGTLQVIPAYELG